MSYDDAVAALQGAVESDAQAEANEPSLFRQPEPVQQAAEPSPQGVNAPESAAPVPAAPAQPVAPEVPVDTFDGGQFNPDALPEELRPAWQQLQASYTRKTQELAEQRKQFDGLGDPSDLNQAVELFQKVNDPRNWPQLQQEISGLMEQYGMSPVAPAPAAPEAPVAPPAPTLDLSGLEADPDLAPIAGVIKGLQQQVEDLRSSSQTELASIREERAQAAREAQHAAMVGELQRQEGVLLQQGMSEADLNFVYDIAASPNFQGNLLQAAERFNAMKESVLSGYLASKSEVAGTVQAPIAGAGSVSTPATVKPTSLENATDIAMETLKAAGLDTIDW